MSRFKWSEKENCYLFETELITGSLVPQGKLQGIHSLIHKKEGEERIGVYTRVQSPEQAANYGGLTGKRLFLLDLYHYMARNLKEGIKGRDMEATHKIIEDGVEINFLPKPPCLIHTKAVYRITGPDRIDLEIQVRAEEEYKDFELWLSSYTPGKANGAYFYLYDGLPTSEKGRQCHFFQPKVNEFFRGFYLAYPRDNHTAALTYDGRWVEEHHQTFVTGRYYAEPITVVLNEDTGFAYIEMAQKARCSKICGSYMDSDIDPQVTNDYTPFYTVLFGCDIAKGQTLTAKVRSCLTKMDKNFDIPIELYRKFREETGQRIESIKISGIPYER